MTLSHMVSGELCNEESADDLKQLEWVEAKSYSMHTFITTTTTTASHPRPSTSAAAFSDNPERHGDPEDVDDTGSIIRPG